MSTLYEIEISGEDDYATTIVDGLQAPAGEVPEAVEAHARLLAQIVGGLVEVRVGWHQVAQVGRVTEHASTVWLDEWSQGVPR